MNEREFASKLINDKGFIVQAALQIPEDVLRRLAAESAAQAEVQKRGEQQDGADMGELIAEYFEPVSQAMGFGDVDQHVLASEIGSQFDALGFMAKVKFGVRYAKAIVKANKQFGIK